MEFVLGIIALVGGVVSIAIFLKIQMDEIRSES